jgi:hypothetical protein
MWECREHAVSELFPNGYLSDDAGKTLQRLKTSLTAPEYINWQLSSSSVLLDKPIMAWSKIVTDYSSRNLSNLYDKLYAISGISRAMKRPYGEFVAGLWKDYIRMELLWTSPDGIEF